MSTLLFTRRINGARAIAAAIGAAMSVFAFDANAANTITFGSNNNSCGGAVMCSTDGTHGYTKDGSGQAFNLSTINQWFQIDVNGASELSGQPAEPDKGVGGFLVLNDTGSAVSSFSLTITDDFTSSTASVHTCSGAQKGNICDNFTAHGGSGTYKFNTELSGTDWDRCTQGTISGQTCTGAPGGVAADFAPNSVTYTWTGQNGSTIPAGSYFVISFTGWNNDAAPPLTPWDAYIALATPCPPCGDVYVAVLDTATNTVTTTVQLPYANVAGATVSPDGSTVYVTSLFGNNGLCGSCNAIAVISAASNTLISTIPINAYNTAVPCNYYGGYPNGVAVSPDGSTLYVTVYCGGNGINGSVFVINTATQAVTAMIPVGVEPYYPAVSPDGSKVYVPNLFSGTVSVINTASNSVTATISVGGTPDAIAISPDGTQVYVSNSAENDVSVINVASNTVIATIPVGQGPYGLAFSPNGSNVYVANQGGGVSVINVASQTVTATINVGSGTVGVSLTPDGSRVYVEDYAVNGGSGGSGTVSVIDAANNTVTAQIPVGGTGLQPGIFIQP
ncbi:MAG TPA: YncE family protein [Rhizomicrobium sp.]|jgi:YVTN family beta-propeller protein|nr:YncE family protein [Rhizomicrobium sp.]